jgi:hypothetical protein
VIASAHDRIVGGPGLGPAWGALRSRVGLVAVLFALAAVAWWSTGGQMRDMDGGPWTGLGAFGWFLGAWLVMMAAMMLPWLPRWRCTRG